MQLYTAIKLTDVKIQNHKINIKSTKDLKWTEDLVRFGGEFVVVGAEVSSEILDKTSITAQYTIDNGPNCEAHTNQYEIPAYSFEATVEVNHICLNPFHTVEYYLARFADELDTHACEGFYDKFVTDEFPHLLFGVEYKTNYKMTNFKEVLSGLCYYFDEITSELKTATKCDVLKISRDLLNWLIVDTKISMLDMEQYYFETTQYLK